MDNLLCKSQFVVEKEKVVTNCLQHLSRHQQLRKDWVTLIGEGFSKPVAVFVLQKVCIMFEKSIMNAKWISKAFEVVLKPVYGIRQTM